MILNLNLLILDALFNSLDCCRDKLITQDGRQIQHFVSDGTSPVQIPGHWSRRRHQVRVGSAPAPGHILLADGSPGSHQLPRHRREREQGQGQVQHAREDAAAMWTSSREEI